MSNGYKKGPYNELCRHMWDSLAPVLHTLLCNPVGPGQFCALPSDCLDLSSWTCLYTMHHLQWTCSVPRSLPVNICHATVESDAPYLPVFMLLHILHTPSPTGSGFHWFNTHHTHTNQNTLHTWKTATVLEDHPSLIWHTYVIHS